jgi:hypothetical protein
VPAEKPVAKPAMHEPAAEQVQAVIDSGDLIAMERVLGRLKSLLQRHFLLSALVKKVYSRKDEASYRAKLYDYGQTYFLEFDEMAPILKRHKRHKGHAEDKPMEVPVLKWLAITMEEDGKYEEALEICELALKWNLDDGTKTGFQGRIGRIQKKQATG